MRKLFQVRLNLYNSVRESSNSGKIKIIWDNKYSNIQNLKKKTNKYALISYEEQLKLKKEDFKAYFNNVLITLSYDSKLTEEIKNKQQLLGEIFLENLADVIPLKCFEKSTSLTKDKLAVGYSDSAGLKKAVGKAIWKDGSSEEEIKTQYYGLPIVSTKFFDSYPDDFKIVSQYFEEFINTNCLPFKGRLSFYSKNWNWSELEVRRNGINKMAILPINPCNLNQTEFEKQKNDLKAFFLKGPGAQCLYPNDSLYIKTLNPTNEHKIGDESLELVFGQPFIKNISGGKTFSFYAHNYYSSIYESYSNLNEKLADTIRKKTPKNEILIELDTANGILGVLTSGHCKKFYSIPNYKHSLKGIEENFKNNGLTDEYYCIKRSISKANFHLKSIIADHGEDCRIHFVYQHFDFNLHPPVRKIKKSLLINLRSFRQVKQIFFVANLGASFKLEQYCYELMTAERPKNKIEGEPFFVADAYLVDYKPNSNSCYAIIRLERE